MEQEQKSHKIEIVKSLILRVFSFLEEEYDYMPFCVVEDSSAIFIESLDVHYINKTLKRDIRISYTKSNIFGEDRYTFSASIVRLPDNGLEDFFGLNIYLQSIGNDFPTSIVNEFKETEVENILAQIATALKEFALKIIDGTDWLEAYYPRKD